ncbi:neurotrimin-like isoform X2 [Diabrotica virgifera virgifera]|uniref:Ig-like domain-containing protein n=1 Tax=Diabrotica virgifera virgifera TaxID=50390 RepID=A0ABM5JME0_DIAVI|nr:neurotrimin-like isoform X2 [Diabrotica virgifera virgifera]
MKSKMFLYVVRVMMKNLQVVLITYWLTVGVAVGRGYHHRGDGRHVRNIDSNGISVLGGDFNHDLAFPRFSEPIPNVTVTVGRDALLACVVDNLRGFKVAWVRVDTQTILSIHHNVITQNPRISLSYNDHKSWYLHIKNVQEVDRGWYMCQVNTDPMRSRQGYLQVVVPPSIIDKETSSDMVVLESTNVSLTCKATGYPEPYVMWRREDGEDIRYNGENVNVVDGEILFITKVSRLHMAVYLCIASNGVPPSISKRVQLKVQFPPMLSIPNQLEGAYVGQDVTLECRTEAFPTSINYWTTERGDMIISGSDKYEAVSMDNGYKKYMMLKIRRVTKIDFGSYKCVAKNSLGETDGVIKLEEIPAPTTVKTTTHLATPVAKKDYDYDSEYTLPSNGPPPIQEPPGAFSGASRNFSSGGVVVFCFFLSILFFFFASAAAASSDEGPR